MMSAGRLPHSPFGPIASIATNSWSAGSLPIIIILDHIKTLTHFCLYKKIFRSLESGVRELICVMPTNESLFQCQLSNQHFIFNNTTSHTMNSCILGDSERYNGVMTAIEAIIAIIIGQTISIHDCWWHKSTLCNNISLVLSHYSGRVLQCLQSCIDISDAVLAPLDH